jgi:hypothetical protein
VTTEIDTTAKTMMVGFRPFTTLAKKGWFMAMI